MTASELPYYLTVASEHHAGENNVFPYGGPRLMLRVYNLSLIDTRNTVGDSADKIVGYCAGKTGKLLYSYLMATLLADQYHLIAYLHSSDMAHVYHSLVHRDLTDNGRVLPTN